MPRDPRYKLYNFDFMWLTLSKVNIKVPIFFFDFSREMQVLPVSGVLMAKMANQ